MNRKYVLSVLVILVILTLTCQTFGADNRYRIAVLPFDDGSIQHRWWGGSWDVGKGVSDELVTELLNTNQFRLIEREQIEKILREQDFGLQGRVDQSSAAKIGKILGVHFLVMGKVTEFSTDSRGGSVALQGGFGLNVKSNVARVAIDARMVDATTAEITAAVTGRGEKKQTNVGVAVNWNSLALGSNEFKQTNLGIALRDAVTNVAKQLAEKAYVGAPPSSLPSTISGLVAYASSNKVIINIGSKDGVQPGMIFEIHHVLEVIKDPATGEVIDEVTEPVMEVSVAEVKEKSATCLVLKRLSSRYQVAVGDKAKQKM